MRKSLKFAFYQINPFGEKQSNYCQKKKEKLFEGVERKKRTSRSRWTQRREPIAMAEQNSRYRLFFFDLFMSTSDFFFCPWYWQWTFSSL